MTDGNGSWSQKRRDLSGRVMRLRKKREAETVGVSPGLGSHREEGGRGRKRKRRKERREEEGEEKGGH